MKKIKISPRIYLFGAFVLLTVPLRWLVAWLLAAAVHECCHILMILVCKGKFLELRLEFGGAVIEIAPMSPGRELLCALAGPLGCLLLLPLVRWMPVTVLCALVQSLWNLMPVYPMDGGRILRCFLCMIFGWPRGEAISRLISAIFSACFVCVAVYGLIFRNWGLFPLLAALFSVHGMLREKFLAKADIWGYNSRSYVQKRYCND